jgi:hypothetical protein
MKRQEKINILFVIEMAFGVFCFASSFVHAEHSMILQLKVQPELQTK